MLQDSSLSPGSPHVQQFPEQKLRAGHDVQLMPGTERWEGQQGGWAAVGRADNVSVLSLLWACPCVCGTFVTKMGQQERLQRRAANGNNLWLVCLVNR